MALTGNNTEERIWNHLKGWILNDYGVAALMGNLYAESGLNPRNLQNSFEKKLGFTDESYTAAVDSEAYTGFVHDGAGYGLAQWTYSSRKAALLAYALILAINRPIEMLVTSLNVVGDAVTSICVAKSEGKLDETKYNAN